MNVVEKDDDVVENEVWGPDGDDYYEEYHTCMVRKLMLSPKCNDETQHLEQFRTRCTVQGCVILLLIVGVRRT